jgi:hypothetical protein
VPKRFTAFATGSDKKQATELKAKVGSNPANESDNHKNAEKVDTITFKVCSAKKNGHFNLLCRDKKKWMGQKVEPTIQIFLFSRLLKKDTIS